MNGIVRIFRHLGYPGWWLRRLLPASSLERIRAAVADSETRHGGEIRVALEANLGLLPLLRGQTARQRAEEVFSSLRVWDTELNNGVLIYLLLADRSFEIVADRGLANSITQEEWEMLCLEMESNFKAGRHEAAVTHGIETIGRRMEGLYPHRPTDANELPDLPDLL